MKRYSSLSFYFFFFPFEVGNRRECSYVGRNDPVYTDQYHKNKNNTEKRNNQKSEKNGIGLDIAGSTTCFRFHIDRGPFASRHKREEDHD